MSQSDHPPFEMLIKSLPRKKLAKHCQKCLLKIPHVKSKINLIFFQKKHLRCTEMSAVWNAQTESWIPICLIVTSGFWPRSSFPRWLHDLVRGGWGGSCGSTPSPPSSWSSSYHARYHHHHHVMQCKLMIHNMISSPSPYQAMLKIDNLLIPKVDSGNPDAKRLYDDLLSNYNKLVLI